MNKIRFIYLIFIALLLASCNEKTDDSLNSQIWFNYPAEYWNSQALHLGNSYFGASFFGGVDEEVFAITEKSMWTGGPGMGNWESDGINPRALESLPVIRDAIVSGKTQLADSLVNMDFFGTSDIFGHFTSAGELKIKFNGHDSEAENYIRTLDLENSLGTVEYNLNNVTYKREYFCSYPDRVLAIKLSAGIPGNISFSLSSSIMQDSSIVQVENNLYKIKGFINESNRPFHILVWIKNSGGELISNNSELSLRNADVAELYMTIATDYEMRYPDYKGPDPEQFCSGIMQKLSNVTYDELKQRHIEDYSSLYDRVNFSLESDSEIEKLPTNERYNKLKAGGSDPGYKILAFNLGRYMIISSSRPNSLPANLQGVWNAFNVAPWAGNYQSNINLQEIYWSCGPTNLDECQVPYIEWIGDLANSGREVAKRVYGTNGWISHTTGNIWGHAAPTRSHPWGMYPVGAAWHCQHLWDHFQFTGDREYLQNHAYTLMKEASVFWLENLIPFKEYLISAPSVSAEHGALMTESGLNPAFHDFRSDKYHYDLPGNYQDAEMIWDLFTNTSKAAIIMGETIFADSLLKMREKLLPLKIGKHGQLQEWFEDIDSPDCHHRHIAHLYAVAPGTQIHPVINKELSEAAKKALDMRGDGRFMEQELASGGNWARAHRMWSWTRLMDGNRANKILTELLTEQGFENGLTYQHADYHWERKDFFMEGELYCHFQLDASASIPGCIAEMLLQSHLGEIHLLPALPDEFKTGKMTGIKARGGFTIDLEWENLELKKATIHTGRKTDLPVIRLKENIIDPEEYSEMIIITE